VNERLDRESRDDGRRANWWKDAIDDQPRKTTRRLLSRLRARRWLLASVALVIVFFVIAAALSPRFALIGFAAIVGAAAVLPREGVRQRLSAVRQASADRGSRIHAAYKAIVDALPEPALILDADGNVLFFNRSAGELFPAARTGLHMSSLSRNPDLLEAIENVELTGSVTVVYSERVPVERRMATTIAELRDSHLVRRKAACLVSFRDMTEQERLGQMRADFIANVSHELRTPLASVRGFIETLQGPARDDPEARRRFLEIMAEQSGRMTRLIDDLLSLSRIEMKAHLIPADEVDIVQTVKYASATLEPLAKNRSIKLTMAAAPADEIWVKGERDELVQVFQNLIQNGLKYGRNGGKIDVEFRRRPAVGGQPRRIAVSVSDDGPGIAPEHVPRITERFYRVDVASSREKGGTGLGLAIVKNVVNRHRGELEITSSPGKGSTFTVVLPELREVTKPKSRD